MANAAKEFRIVRGGIARTVRGMEARRRIQREMHTMVVQTPQGAKVGGRWWWEVRRGRLSPVAGVLRLIDVRVACGATREQVREITEWLRWYGEDACDERDRTQRGALTLSGGRAA